MSQDYRGLGIGVCNELFTVSAEAVNIQTIGKYQVLGTLGRGSMGVVYKARDPEIGRVVAIKTLRRVQVGSLSDTDLALERFRNEARSAGNLRHPNIVTVFEVNHSDDTPYIVMDFVQGEGLDAIIARSAPLPPAQALSYASQIAAGIDYAHSKKVLHRDIKPSNIMVDGQGSAFVLDFGVATLADSYSMVSDKNSGPILGTPGYMSPEQILNQKLSTRSDLFSFAIVVFECFSGKRPFEGDTFSAVVGNILNGKPLSLSAVVPTLPLALEAEFERALAKDPAMRFSTAREMVSAFSLALGFDIAQSGNVTLSNLPARTRKRPSSGWRSIRPKIEAEGSGLKPNSHQQPRPNRPQRTVDVAHELTEAPPGARRVPISRIGLSLFFLPQGSLQKLTLAFSLLSIALGIGLLWILFGTHERTVETSRAEQVVTGVPASSEEAPLRASYSYQTTRRVMEMNDEELLRALKDPSTQEETLLKAIESAGERRILGLVQALFVPLKNDSYIVRAEAIRLLAAIGDPEAVPELILKLDDHDPVVRGHAAKALGILGDRRAVGYLTVRYQREELAVVKSALKKAIEKLNGFPLKE